MLMRQPAFDMDIFWHLLSILGIAVASTATIVLFLMREFSQNRKLFFRVISLHNKEDDDRFEELSNDIWRIHIRNAQRDGDNPPQRKRMPRRRYLTADGGNDEALAG
jgi:hypothetical protein